MKSLRLKPLAIALAGALLLSQVALAATPDIATDNPKPTLREDITMGPGRSISPADESIISASADKVLHHIALAREALRRKDQEHATENLNQAETLLNIIQSAVPTTKVTDRIWSANNKFQYENVEEVSPSEVPVYATLEEREGFDSVKATDGHAPQPKAQVEQKSGATASSKPKELVADDTTLYYEELDLPLNAVRHFVSAAQMELAKHHFMAADQHLRAAQDSVDFVSVDVPEPLVTAKTNLQRANEHFVAGKIADAKVDVGRAITQLTQAEQQASAETKQDAQKLLSDAQSLQARIDHGDPSLTTDLKGLWHHTEALADRAKEYTAMGWTRLRHQGKLRSDLIEAKRFVADADIDANVANDPTRSMQDLHQAKDYLDKAATDAAGKSTLEANINDMKATLDGLLDGKTKTNPGEMANLKSQIGQIIRSL